PVRGRVSSLSAIARGADGRAPAPKGGGAVHHPWAVGGGGAQGRYRGCARGGTGGGAGWCNVSYCGLARAATLRTAVGSETWQPISSLSIRSPIPTSSKNTGSKSAR